jgi:DNA primase
MAKLAQNFAKYMILARLNATGIVEKPDVIGAIFGQTEGLLGGDLDLRELQRTGRIGRIEVNVKSNKGKAYAEITIPSSLDGSETALIAASLETIEKVGPCDAKIEVAKVEDVRTQKRRFVVERAKDILRTLMDEFSDSQSLAEQIRQAVRTCEVSMWNGLACGPDVQASDEIVICEGRADVINLLKAGIRNCIAIEGSKIPDAVSQLTREKTVTAMLDGDRGGDLILKKLLSVAEIDFVARADAGLEVEELTKKQIYKSLRDKVAIDAVLSGREDLKQPLQPSEIAEVEEREVQREIQRAYLTGMQRTNFQQLLEQLVGTRAAFLTDKDGQVLSKVPMSELSIVIEDFPDTEAIVADTKVSQELVDLCLQKRVKYLIGMGWKEQFRVPGEMSIFTIDDLKPASSAQPQAPAAAAA